MAALDFPAAPTIGQIYPAPNGVVYQWSGVIWQAVKGLADNGAAFHAYASGVSVPASPGVMPLATPTFNKGGYLVGSRFTPPAGIYALQAAMGAQGGTSTSVYAYIYKNGFVIGAGATGYAGAGGIVLGPVASMIVEANGTDYFEAYWQTTGAQSVLGNPWAFFSGAKVDGMQGPPGVAGTPAGVTPPAYHTNAAYLTFNGQYAADDNVPTTAGGNRLFLQNYTANNPAHRVRVRSEGWCYSTIATNFVLALFVDGICVRTKMDTKPASYSDDISLVWEGLLSAGVHSYEIRIGSNVAGFYCNGNSTTRLGGGTSAWTLQIEELNAP